MIEKLVELQKEAGEYLSNICIGHSCEQCPYDRNGIDCDAYVKADYLIDHGVTILPCNVGDKIYYIDRHTQTIEEDTVKFLTITKSGIKPILESHNIKFWDFYKWGKSVFANRAEAESALVNR